MFSKLLSKIVKNKRNLLWIIVGVSLFFVMSDSAFAADQTSTFADTKKKVSEVVQFISTIIAVFLALITYLTTMFLSPEWINGSLFGLNVVFKSIWVMISNVVYLIFAFILIFISFMNIIGKGQEKYALKQALPKFVIGILIVPFSWFLVNFILSISSVLTISALNIPFDTFQDYKVKISAVKIPTKCTFNPDNLSQSGATAKTGTTSNGQNLQKILNCEKESKVPLLDLLNSDKPGDSIFGVVALYTYGVLNLESFDNLNEDYIGKVQNMAQLVIKLVFDFLFIVVYSVLMIALGLVLMTRGIYLWIYMMMSPIFGLMYFFDKTSGGGEFFDKFNLKQFISLAFVPVLSMLALSFGMLFIYMVGNGITKGPSSDDPPSTITIEKDTFTINDKISLKIEGSASTDQSITDLMKEISEKGLGVIGTLILKIFGIVVLWGAVMAALRSNDITKAVVQPLYDFGTKVGEIATKSPQYAPIFGGQSMSSLSTAASQVSSHIQSKQTEKAGKLVEPFVGSSRITDLDKLKNSIKGANGDIKTINPNVGDIIKKAGSFDQVKSIQSAREGIYEALKAVLTDKEMKDLKVSGEADLKNTEILLNAIKKLDDIGQQKGADLFRGQTPDQITVDSINKFAKGIEPDTTKSPVGNQTINLNINGNNTKFDQTKVSRLGLSQEDIGKINSIKGDISNMTNEQFIGALKLVGINDNDRIKQIIDFLITQGVTFK